MNASFEWISNWRADCPAVGNDLKDALLVKGLKMNGSIDLDRTAILRNASAIRSTWTNDERRQRALAARRYSRMLFRMVSEPKDEDLWAVGAPTDIDLSRLERAG